MSRTSDRISLPARRIRVVREACAGLDLRRVQEQFTQIPEIVLETARRDDFDDAAGLAAGVPPVRPEGAGGFSRRGNRGRRTVSDPALVGVVAYGARYVGAPVSPQPGWGVCAGAASGVVPPRHRASVGCGAGVMSQKVKITRARVHGSPVYLGDVTAPDGTVAPVWSADPARVLGWLARPRGYADAAR